jgi:UPF0755 protein
MQSIKSLLVKAGTNIKNSSSQKKMLFFFVILIFFSSLLLIKIASAPNSFPSSSTIRIEKGKGLSQTALVLQQEGYIRSSFLFKVFVALSGRAHTIIAGDYYFDKKENGFVIARRLTEGDYKLVEIKVTIPEGLTVFQIADVLKSKFSLFNPAEFITNAKEGYLFPDTYFFFPNVNSADVISKMTNNFDVKLAPYEAEIASSSRSFADIIIMASIIEEEAQADEDRPIVAGILWNRLSIDMPLQVDATFSYVNGKNTYTLTRADLKEDSPYNTYLYKGLPPTPIANPSIKSIEAALRPTETEYLYFLSDLSGKMYYAKDFDGHQINRENYLRR